MRMRFLGSTSEAGACPTLYETDRGTIVVQGLRLTDTEALADSRDILDGETAVEVPANSSPKSPAGSCPIPRQPLSLQ